MMRFPENFIQEVVDRTDIEELIGRYVTLKRAGSNLLGLCPFHSEKTPSFSVSPTKKMFFCFGCHAGGSVITFVEKAENLDFPDAVEFLANRAGLPLPQVNSPQEEQTGVTRKRVLEMNLEAAKFFRACLFDPSIGRVGMAYFKENRHLTEATIRHFGLGFAPDSFNSLTDYLKKKGYRDEELIAACLAGKSQKTGRAYDYFRNRVIFPIIDPSGNIVAFGGRVMDDSKPKYLNSSDTPAFKKSKQLFALNFAKNVSSERMILCEGYMDVIALHEAGFEYAVATLGTAITPDHARIFSKYTQRVIISYDADEAGQNAANKAMKILGEVGMEVRVLKIPDAKDPDEFIRKFGADKFRRVLDESKTGFEYKLSKILAAHDIGENAEKVKATNEVCTLIAEYHSGVEREIYLADASEKLGLPKEILKNSVELIRRKYTKDFLIQKSREAQNSIRNFGDRVNPDAAKNPRAASAEETVLGLLLLYPEYRDLVAKGEIILTDENFTTAFSKRVFAELMRMHRTENGYHFELFGETFTPDEVGRIRQMEVQRQQLTENGSEVFRSAIRTLSRVREEENMKTEDVGAQVARLRERKQKSQKGKADNDEEGRTD